MPIPEITTDCSAEQLLKMLRAVVTFCPLPKIVASIKLLQLENADWSEVQVFKTISDTFSSLANEAQMLANDVIELTPISRFWSIDGCFPEAKLLDPRFRVVRDTAEIFNSSN